MPTSLIIADLLDHLVEAVEAARVAAKDDKRWSNAVETGYNWLLQQETIAYDLDRHELTVPSATTEGRTYIANGSCQCKAFEQHNACWHRAAARLIRRAFEHYGDEWDKDCSAMRAELKAQRTAQATADLMECF